MPGEPIAMRRTRGVHMLDAPNIYFDGGASECHVLTRWADHGACARLGAVMCQIYHLRLKAVRICAICTVALERIAPREPRQSLLTCFHGGATLSSATIIEYLENNNSME